MRRLAIVLMLGIPLTTVSSQVVPADPSWSPSRQQALQEIVDVARGQGLPIEVLLSKIREGKARGISVERITAAVRGYADAMLAARHALEPGASADEIDAGAAALRAGAPAVALEGVRAARRPGTGTTALVVLTDLLSRGIIAEEATGAVLRSLRVDQDDATTRALRNAVAGHGSEPLVATLRRFVDRLPSAPNRPMPDRP